MSGIFDDDGDEPDDEGDDLLGGADDGLLGDDGFGDDDGDGADDVELNYQLDEIEKEVDSLKNKVDTVRGENEKISESIESVERNVDKLVDLYEIVTHGVNPFVGDQEIGDAFDSAIGDAGMFGDDPDDVIDEEIADAEAEDFLDDDMPFEDDDDEFDDEFDEDPLEDEMDDEFDEDPLEEDEFEDEFAEETDADPLEEDEGDEDDSEEDLTQFLPSDEEELFTSEEGADDAGDDLEEAHGLDDGPTAPAVDATGENGEIGDPPYLVRHPSQYAAEVRTLEWVAHLVETAGVDGAAQTVAYYRSVGWISEAVETYLQSLLCGFGDAGTVPEEDPDPQSVLSTNEHKRSLQYIARIATPEKRTAVAVDGPLDEREEC